MLKISENIQQYNQKKHENESVKFELDIVGDSDGVFKLVGPVLIKEDLAEARQTINKRIEFINKEV
jgi:prefoldin beta subunit